VNTYFIGREEIKGYVVDLFDRLESLETFPQVWCPITKSGDAIQEELLAVIKQRRPERLEGLVSVPIGVSRASGQLSVTFPEETDLAGALGGKTVLLLDGAIHSGDTMNRCVAEIMRFKPSEVSSYSLVMKGGSSFIPTFWAVAIGETDRAFFLLETIPNHRLDAGASRNQPPVHLERLSERHLEKPLIQCGVPSMDRGTWSDRLFQMQVANNPPCTYLLVRGDRICGYLTIHGAGKVLSVDEVAVDPALEGTGYGGILLRFADTVARQTDCYSVQLLAIEKQVPKYQRFEYTKFEGRSPIKLDTETYWPMERAVIYHHLRY
jgi:GNAT superfamily N-acetyltransferase